MFLQSQIFTFLREPVWPGPDVSGSVLAGAGHCSGSEEQKSLCLKIVRGISVSPTISLALSRAALSAFQAMTGSPTYLASSRKY